MRSGNRLDKLTPVLSAKERYIISLRAQKAGTEEHIEVRRTMPSNQRKEFNYYVDLVYCVNGQLFPFCFALASLVDALEDGRERINKIEAAANELARCPSDTTLLMTSGRKSSEMTASEFLLDLARVLRKQLLESVRNKWQDLRAVETIWAEVAAELDGEDPADLESRRLLTGTREKLQDLAGGLAGRRAQRLSEPSVEVVERFRELVPRAFGYLNLAEE